MQFSGVNEAWSAHRLLQGVWSPRIARIRNSYHRLRSGDILIDVLPGWTIVEEHATDNRVVRHAAIPAPLVLTGKGVKAQTRQAPVSILRIAPTLAGAMQIRAPNACEELKIEY
jgi:hypothetical protein